MHRLKYLQTILANSVNEYNVIDLSDIAHEYSLFTVSLLLAYKFLEDNPPYMVICVYITDYAREYKQLTHLLFN